MPSQLHEALLLLFRNRPTLALELLRDALHADWLPPYTDARIDSADLGDVQPAEYRADLVVRSLHHVRTVQGVIVEVQRSPDPRKRFAWPAYCTNLRARLNADAVVLVVTVDEATARWAAEPIHLGGDNWFRPLVLRPGDVPEILDEERARSHPELAVLSAMAHGRDADAAKAARIAAAAAEASLGLDEDRSRLYVDLSFASLSDAARKELQAMDPAKYEYQSEFAKRYVARGRADLIIRQLTLRFGPPSEDVLSRIAAASIEELDAIGERLLSASTIDEALGAR